MDEAVSQKNMHSIRIPYKTLIIHFEGVIEIYYIYFTSSKSSKSTQRLPFVIQIIILRNGITR